MRLAIISDIHGNFLALQEVIRDIDKNNIDHVICLGDIITLGLEPLQVLSAIKKLNWVFILGNHESALFDMNKALHFKIAPAVIPVLQWCKSKLSPDDMDFLRSFKRKHSIPLESHGELLCFHGSPQSNTDLITCTTDESKVEDYFSKYQHSFFAGGHSHLQMLRQHQGKLIINPGSVGMPFLNTPQKGQSPGIMPWAEYAVIDCNEAEIAVNLKRVHYNISALKVILEKSDIPLKEWWQEQLESFN